LRTSESKGTSNSMILVPLWTRSSQPDSRQVWCELRVRGTSSFAPRRTARPGRTRAGPGIRKQLRGHQAMEPAALGGLGYYGHPGRFRRM